MSEAPSTTPARSPVRAAALVLIPALAGVGTGLVAPRPGRASAASAAAAPALELWEMPELIVNLAEADGKRYLKVRLSFQTRGAAGAAKARLEERLPLLRDGVIRRLSARTLAQVETTDAKDAVKLELLDLVNRTAFEDGLATAEQLFFMEFIVQ